MIHTLSLSTGEPQTLEPYDSSAPGAIQIPGDEVYYAEGSFGRIIVRETFWRNYIFRHTYINWKKPTGITITYRYDKKVISIRALIETPFSVNPIQFNEAFRNGGKSILKTNQFNCVAGQSWTTTITVGDPCQQHFIDVIMPEKEIDAEAKKYNHINFAVNNNHYGIACKVIGPSFQSTTRMCSLVDQMMEPDLANEKFQIRESIKEYFREALKEITSHEAIKKRLMSNYEPVKNATEHIFSDPSVEINIEELAAKCLISETNLKLYFPQYTDLSLENYRKYILIQKANLQIVKGKGQITANDMAGQAGYKSKKGYIKGSVRLHSCSPEELETMEFIPDKPMEPEESGIRVLLNKHFVMTW